MKPLSPRIARQLTPWIFLALPLAIYGVMIAYPIVYSCVLSLFNWDGISPERRFIGLENYKSLFESGALVLALKNNAIWMLVFVPLPVLVGFFLALALYDNTKVNVLLRSAFYLPMILSFTVMSIIWTWVYEPNRGLLKEVLSIVGLPFPKESILVKSETSMLAISVVGAWHWIGFPLILYLAALKDIPTDLFNAANLDGATWLQRLRYVVIPLVRHATMISISIGIVLSVKVFDLVFLMAGGYYKNDVLSTLVWRQAFSLYKLGSASAVSVVQFGIVVLILIPYLWNQVKTRTLEF